MAEAFVIISDPSPRALARRLRELGREFRSWRPAWRAALPYVARGVHGNLTSQGSSLSSPWPPLQPATLRRKARMGQSRGMLIGTGASIADPLSGGGASVEISATRMRYGIPGLVPNVQHFGSSKRRIPARRFMAWTPAMENAVLVQMDALAKQLLAVASQRIGGDKRGTR